MDKITKRAATIAVVGGVIVLAELVLCITGVACSTMSTIPLAIGMITGAVMATANLELK